MAGSTHAPIAQANLTGRHTRDQKVELAHRAHILAERRAGEYAINYEDGDEVADNDPRGSDGPIPERELRVTEQPRRKEPHCHPLVPQARWPRESRGDESSRQITHKD